MLCIAFLDHCIHAHNIVKDVLYQIDSEGRRGKWIAKIQEYNLEIKPTKSVKGQELPKLLDESNCQALDLNLSTELTYEENFRSIQDVQNIRMKLNPKFEEPTLYKDIVYCLVNLECLEYISKEKSRSLKLHAMK